jgi:predicted MFS family arabinose efflux permease
MGASKVFVGVVIGVFGLAWVLRDLPIGAMAQSYGAKRIMFVSLLIVVVASTLAATTWSLVILMTARILEGIGSNLFLVAGLALLARIARTERRGSSAVGFENRMFRTPSESGCQSHAICGCTPWPVVGCGSATVQCQRGRSY